LRNSHFPQGFNNIDFSPDVIGIQALTSNLNNAINLAWFLKARNPNALIVFGGISPTQTSAYLLELGVADIVVHGEGEQTFSELIHDHRDHNLKNKTNIKGISYLDEKGKYRRNPPRGNIENLDILPLPSRDLADIEFYKKISPGRVGNLI